jgi:ABC-2 type transport system permease protein
MFKALLISRMRAFLAYFLRRGKKKKSAGMTVLLAILFIYVIGCFGMMFGMLFSQLCEPFHMLGLDWLYFGIASILSLALMFIGSIFMTQAQLFEAQDNEFLLSMPIPTGYILASRMVALYLFNLIFELLVMLPAIIVYVNNNGITAASICITVVLVIILPLLSLAIASIIGWLIALLTSRVRNKSLLTVVFSLIFFAVYFYAYSRVNEYIQTLIVNGELIAKKIRGAVLPIYWFGESISGGNFGYMFLGILCCIIPFTLVYMVLNRTFIHVATSKRGFAKKKFKTDSIRVNTPNKTLLFKELKHFVASPVYMLNGTLGVIVTLIIAGALIIKRDAISEMINMFSQEGLPIGNSILMWIGIIIGCSGITNILTAPSISLEGKSLWILQSLPVETGAILRAKINFQLLITIPPVLITDIIAIIFYPVDAISLVILITFPIVMNLLIAIAGLIMNLLLPNLDWVSETAAVKQSASPIVTMLIGLAMILVPVLLYIFIFLWVSITWYIIGVTIVYGILSASGYRYLMHGGVKIFQKL